MCVCVCICIASGFSPTYKSHEEVNFLQLSMVQHTNKPFNGQPSPLPPPELGCYLQYPLLSWKRDDRDPGSLQHFQAQPEQLPRRFHLRDRVVILSGKLIQPRAARFLRVIYGDVPRTVPPGFISTKVRRPKAAEARASGTLSPTGTPVRTYSSQLILRIR